MFRALYTAASGMYAQQQNMDEISENLANAQTTAYKKGRVDFEDLIYASLAEPEALGSYAVSNPVSSHVGSGVRAAGFEKIFTPGDLYHTGNALDTAIQGNGFFQVKLDDGSLGYTRDGILRVSKDGRLMAGGHPLAGVTIPAKSAGIEIAEDGTIKALVGNDKNKEAIGKIKLARFLNPEGLRLQGNVFLETPVSGSKIEGTAGDNGFGLIKSGYIEKANINLVEEMMNMVLAQRIYEFNAKAVQAADENMRLTTQLMPK